MGSCGVGRVVSWVRGYHGVDGCGVGKRERLILAFVLVVLRRSSCGEREVVGVDQRVVILLF